MKKLLLSTMAISSCFSNNVTIYSKLESCLLTHYSLNNQVINIIAQKFAPFLENINFHHSICEFIEKSSTLHIPLASETIKDSASFMRDDAVMKAPEFHAILFENPLIRILETVVKPGQREPFHRHYWKSFMIIVSGANFIIDYADGTQEESSWPIGFYELPADGQSASYLNKGDSEFRALRFEFKE